MSPRIAMREKTVLLTGGSGFVGRNLRDSYLAERYVLLAPSSRELNCADEQSVDDYFRRHRIDAVVHSAVKPGHRNAKDLSDLFYTNTRMFFNLERHRDDYEKMLVIGSGAIYDCRDYRPLMREEEWCDRIPADEHGYCKYVCEKTIEHSANIIDLRVFGIFGPHEDYAIRFISNAICKTLFDLPITLRQDRRFSYLWVDDLAPVVEWFLEHTPRHRAYNIAPDEVVSLYELAQLVGEVSGKNPQIVVGQEGMGSEYSGNNLRLRTEMPDVRFTPFREAVERLYRWYESRQSELDRALLIKDK